MSKFRKCVISILAFMPLFCGCDMVAQPNDDAELNNELSTISPEIFQGDPNFIECNNVVLTYDGNYNFVASGEPTKMIESQAYTWGVKTGTMYAVLVLDTGLNNTIVYGWRSLERRNEPFKASEIDNNLVTKTRTISNKEYIMLYLSDGPTKYNHVDKPIWRVDFTKAGTNEKVSYTVDFSNILK